MSASPNRHLAHVWSPAPAGGARFECGVCGAVGRRRGAGPVVAYACGARGCYRPAVGALPPTAARPRVRRWRCGEHLPRAGPGAT